MIENNIKQSLGVGSGIDTKQLVDQLVEIERMGPQGRIDKKRELTEAKISDFGRLASELGTLQSAVNALKDREGLFSKSASFTDSTALMPVALDTTTQPGTYVFEVGQIAKSHSLAFQGLAKMDAKVGEGTLSFSFGQWDRSAAPPSFSAGSAAPLTVTIDATNNSLTGLRDAINALEGDLQASIVSDGNQYRLVVAAPSGEANEVMISVEPAEGEAAGAGLSRFAFDAGVADLSAVETQAGQNAHLTLNGLQVSRATNKITDLVPGLTLDVLKPSGDQPITITISEDKAKAEAKIREFVTAFNDFFKNTRPLFGYNEEEERAGALKNDSAARAVFTQLRASFSGAVPGLTGTAFSSLATVGIRTALDGTLTIHEETFRETLNDNFSAVQNLFAERLDTDNQAISINKYSERTESGSYQVNVTQQPRRGEFLGETPVSVATGEYEFSITLNGIQSGTIALDAGAAAGDANAMAEALAAAINADPALAAAGAQVEVMVDGETGGFKIQSSRWGSNSTVSFTAASDDFTANFGIAVGDGTAGRDVAGTVNGVEAFGLGNVLLPKLGEAGEGLSLILGEDAVSGTVNVSRGFAGELDRLMGKLLDKKGSIAEREVNLGRDLTRLDDQEGRLDRKMEMFYERLTRQFIAMEAILNGLNSQGGFLENLIDTLPFTARRD